MQRSSKCSQMTASPLGQSHSSGNRGTQDVPGSFMTSRGGPRTEDNVRLRILPPVLARAEGLPEARGEASLPPRISPHSLRHTFASLLFAIGEDPVSVMRLLGHTDPAFTLRVYAHSTDGGADECERLRELADGYEVVGEARREFERHRCDPACGAEWVLDVLNRRAHGSRPGDLHREPLPGAVKVPAEIADPVTHAVGLYLSRGASIEARRAAVPS